MNNPNRTENLRNRNTKWLDIALGFVLGVICTVGYLYISEPKEYNNPPQTTEEPQTRKRAKTIGTNKGGRRNIQSFELNTEKGMITLHTYMSKDSVRTLMGPPNTTNICVSDYRQEVQETWKYKGRNKYTEEFTIKFVNDELISVRQLRDSYPREGN